MLDLTQPLNLLKTDCLSLLAQLPDQSVDLILTDPPYYKVKSNQWDNQWPDAPAFLAWIDSVLSELARVLKPTGSLYFFAGPYMATDIELLVRKHFTLLNRITWSKPVGKHLACCKEALRKYFPQSEVILFAESTAAPKRPAIRRHFAATKTRPYTDVWTFMPVYHHANKHPCEKPKAMLEHIILTSSQPNDIVLDPFLGSGATAKAAVALYRRMVGCDLDDHWFF